MGIFLQFKRHFQDQSSFSVIVIHVQPFHSCSTFLVQETASKKKKKRKKKKKPARINLINT